MLTFSTSRVLVIGLGLIGGSLARALKQRNLVDEVVGYDLNRAECELGLSLGVIDRIGEELGEEASGAAAEAPGHHRSPRTLAGSRRHQPINASGEMNGQGTLAGLLTSHNENGEFLFCTH